MSKGIALAFVATLSVSGVARAQAPDELSPAEQDARSAFEQGRLAFERGDYESALARFERAFGLSGRPELLFNIGIAQERLQQDEQAIDSFERYLARLPDAVNRQEVEARIAQLRRAVNERAIERQEPSGGGSVWVWVAVGAAVVMGAVVAAILLADPGQEGPLIGNTGTHTEALVVRW